MFVHGKCTNLTSARNWYLIVTKVGCGNYWNITIIRISLVTTCFAILEYYNIWYQKPTLGMTWIFLNIQTRCKTHPFSFIFPFSLLLWGRQTHSNFQNLVLFEYWDNCKIFTILKSSVFHCQTKPKSWLNLIHIARRRGD